MEYLKNKSFIKINKELNNTSRINSLEGVEGSLLFWGRRYGQAYTISDINNNFFRARLEKNSDGQSYLQCFEDISNPEPPIFISLFQAVPDKERMEFIIEKSVELGVSQIIPVVTEKSSSIKKRDEKQRKSHNWPKISIKAAKQCTRAIIPEISNELPLIKAVNESLNFALAFYLNQNEKVSRLKYLLKGKKPSSIAVLAGPEAGFTNLDLKIFKDNNILSVSLGSRILRTETAGVCTLSILSHEFEY